MSATGLPVFDKTLHITHLWLHDIMDDIGPDRQAAWKVLCSVLRTLRDRLPVNLAAHLGAGLPLLIRGAYYDQFRPDSMPTAIRTYEEFVDEVDYELSDMRPIDPDLAVQSVFRALSHYLTPGQVSKVRRSLPQSIRRVWTRVEDAALRRPQEPAPDRATAGSVPPL
jgi:uncharacterized protein (DUF2267 family)